MLRHDRLDESHRGANIGVVVDLHGAVDAHLAVRVRVVHDRRRDDRLVGDDVLGAILRSDDHVARREPGHFAVAVVDGHEVAQLHGSVQKDRESAHVVGGDLLQSEAEAHAEGATEDREHRDVDADECQGGEHAQDDQHRLDELRQHDPQAHVQAADRHQPSFGEAAQPEHGEHRHDDRQRSFDHVERGDAVLPDRQDDLVECCPDAGQDAGDVEHRAGPHGPGDRALGSADPVAGGQGMAQHVDRHPDDHER